MHKLDVLVLIIVDLGSRAAPDRVVTRTSLHPLYSVVLFLLWAIQLYSVLFLL